MDSKQVYSALRVSSGDFDFTAINRAKRYEKRGTLAIVKARNGETAIVQGYDNNPTGKKTIADYVATSLSPRHLVEWSHAARCYCQ